MSGASRLQLACVDNLRAPGATWQPTWLLLTGLILTASTCLPLASPLTAADLEQIEEAPIDKYDREHWAYRPLASPRVPDVVDSTWPRNPLDHFVLAKLEARSLHPAQPASRSTLLRRVCFDLTGLPPSEAQTRAFFNDPRADAYERLVDSLLASPEYGRRWGQYWLDLARFADTDGFEHDHPRPTAWQYRDWVIAAINRDLAYDEFVRLQIAGDVIAPDDPQSTIATAFCLSGPDMPDINSQVERKHVLLNEITTTVGAVFMGLQVGCAQCHDHKYDAISQADFYRLRAFFDPALTLKKNESVSVLGAGDGRATMRNLMIRGEWHRPGPTLTPAFVRVANLQGAKPQHQQAGAQRRELAEWLVNPTHPLTARVYANRIWQHHFGAGLSNTPSDFGVMGDEPTHPELLDYLASELIRGDWSTKRLHRQIVLSATYRIQSFAPDTEPSDRIEPSNSHDDNWQRLLASDPTNKRLGRFPRRRLDAEAIRDALFAVSGSLNRSGGGPGVRPPLPAELSQTLLSGQWHASEREADHYRRSVYLFARRNLPYPILASFDRPAASASCAARTTSTAAPQALLLMNSAIMVDAAERLAAVTLAAHPFEQTAQVEELFLRMFSRPPTARERAQINSFLDDQSGLERLAELRELSRGLLNTNLFLYVD